MGRSRSPPSSGARGTSAGSIAASSASSARTCSSSGRLSSRRNNVAQIVAPDEVAGVRAVRLAFAERDDDASALRRSARIRPRGATSPCRLRRRCRRSGRVRRAPRRASRPSRRAPPTGRRSGARSSRALPGRVPLRARQREHRHRLRLALHGHRRERLPAELLAGRRDAPVPRRRSGPAVRST